MSTETTDPLAAAAEPDPAWRSAQQQATNATWQVSAVATPAAPFCISQAAIGDVYQGDLHYTSATPVRTIAREYDVPVTEAPASGGDICVCARVTTDGIEVRAWAIVAASNASGGAAA